MPATRPPPARAAEGGRAGASESALPAQLVSELQSRELGVEDYEMLLQLDAVGAPVPLHQVFFLLSFLALLLQQCKY
jgi:hypothetical protein